MIINTGMRTDIPAFYSKWLINRIQEGYVYTRNPYNPIQVTRYSLSPEVVDIIAFCTKNPHPMLEYMDVLAPYGQYWFVTITPYGTEIEPHVPAKELVMEDFKKLAEIVGPDSVGWRYDPIFISDTYPVERHIADFEKMAETLAGATHTCVISFIDLYQKVQRNFEELRTVSKPDRIRIGKEFIRIAKKYDMVIRPCAEGTELEKYGAVCDGCMTLETFEGAIHGKLDAPKNKSQRAECACMLGKDIGHYDTCAHLCRYCYANSNPEAVRQNRRIHNPNSPFLVGEMRPDDIIHVAKQISWRNNQMSLFDLL